MCDSVDIDYLAYERHCEKDYDADYEISATKADSERHDIPFEQQDRMIAAYNANVLREVTGWVARPRSEESKRLLAAAEAQIQKQYGAKVK